MAARTQWRSTERPMHHEDSDRHHYRVSPAALGNRDGDQRGGRAVPQLHTTLSDASRGLGPGVGAQPLLEAASELCARTHAWRAVADAGRRVYADTYRRLLGPAHSG